MNRIIDLLRDRIGLTCNRFDMLDLDGSSSSEWDENEPPVEEPFEDPPPSGNCCDIGPLLDPASDPLFRFFIDGSRKTYRVADVEHNRRYFPLIAAQVGVAVCERDCRKYGGIGMKPVADASHIVNALVLPDLIGDSDVEAIRSELADLPRGYFEVIRYKFRNDGNPLDLAAAAVMQRMHNMEVKAACDLAQAGALSNDAMLVLDGSLMFRDPKFDIGDFRNVIGIAKRFKPDFTVGKGQKKSHVGIMVGHLEQGQRTIVHKRTFGRVSLGSWYLRLRPKKRVQGTLGGVVKLELFALGDAERENGFDSTRINVISQHVFAERNVTPFGADERWATHLYPMYLTEKYMKSLFMSPVVFRGLF
ncbi:MAG: hypothetical protein HQL74_14025 [Magnetococcales bacterium]|nr:hypothetical protein [Magnetococcales bacterium]